MSTGEMFSRTVTSMEEVVNSGLTSNTSITLTLTTVETGHLRVPYITVKLKSSSDSLS